jgi:hypothetical protein
MREECHALKMEKDNTVDQVGRVKIMLEEVSRVKRLTPY